MNNKSESTIDVVLLATDFSERSRAAEDYALDFAAARGAAIHIVNAIEPIIGLKPSDEDASEFEEFYDKLVARSEQQVEVRIERWSELNLIVQHHVQIGPRWQVILECADRVGADLIVLGRRSYTAEEQISLGTTSQKVFFGSSRPVLCVPAELE